MSEKIFQIAVIGCGRRAEAVIGHLLECSAGGIRFAALYDADPEAMKRARELWHAEDARLCTSTEEAVRLPDVDWVMIFTPNACHKEALAAAFAAGKHVFAEKPLATTLADCEAIYAAWKKSRSHFMTGFVLRYSKLYRKVKELLTDGTVGRIIGIDANENIRPSHGGYIVNSWRGHKALGGPYILEKCCHDLDLLIWFTGSLPARIGAFAGLDFFRRENEGLMTKLPADTFTHWNGYTDSRGNPFVSPKDISDNYVSILKFRNGVKAQFQATMSNEIPERKMFFSCTEGTILVELYSSTVTWQRIGEERHTLFFGADGHGGGDDYIMKEFMECVRTGSAPKSGGSEGLESAVTALAIEKAAENEEIIDLEPVWKKLER